MLTLSSPRLLLLPCPCPSPTFPNLSQHARSEVILAPLGVEIPKAEELPVEEEQAAIEA